MAPDGKARAMRAGLGLPGFDRICNRNGRWLEDE